MMTIRGVLFIIAVVPYCSLGWNKIGDEGAVALAGALNVNSWVTALK
jgi:hypothetical protein